MNYSLRRWCEGDTSRLLHVVRDGRVVFSSPSLEVVKAECQRLNDGGCEVVNFEPIRTRRVHLKDGTCRLEPIPSDIQLP